MFHKAFPQGEQIGGSHYKNFKIQPYEFISKNDLSFFQGNVIKYVCRYKDKDKIKDLERRSIYKNKKGEYRKCYYQQLSGYNPQNTRS